MLKDVLVVGVAFGLWLALGYPVARRLGSPVVWPALAAPPLGIAILCVARAPAQLARAPEFAVSRRTS